MSTEWAAHCDEQLISFMARNTWPCPVQVHGTGADLAGALLPIIHVVTTAGGFWDDAEDTGPLAGKSLHLDQGGTVSVTYDCCELASTPGDFTVAPPRLVSSGR